MSFELPEWWRVTSSRRVIRQPPGISFAPSGLDVFGGGFPRAAGGFVESPFAADRWRIALYCPVGAAVVVFALMPHRNPNGIQAQSPRLRGPSRTGHPRYLGNTVENELKPNGVAASPPVR